jgi:hypothetical protein
VLEAGDLTKRGRKTVIYSKKGRMDAPTMIPDTGIFQREHGTASIIITMENQMTGIFQHELPGGITTNNYPDAYFIVNNRL